nr:hypothetical protein [Patescibacteria group bacterium]
QEKTFYFSKSGYNTREFTFYFKREDANYDVLLNTTDSNIEFLVKDINNNIWDSKYLMFKKINKIITSTKTDGDGYTTASLQPDGNYTANLYDANGDLIYTYQKTTTLVNKPKDEITLTAISPYDVYVGGLLGYSFTNQTADSQSFNIFAGTTGFYYFSVVDYNSTPANRLYIPRQYFVQVPMGSGYTSTKIYQPYLLKKTDAVVPKIVVLDELNKPIQDVDLFISKYINNVLTIVECGKTTGVGTFSFSGELLQYYFINVIYNGVDKGTYRIQPRDSSDTFIIVIDTSSVTPINQSLLINANFNNTKKNININDSNINVKIKVTQNQNLATSYNLYLMQNNSIKSSTTGVITGLTTNIDYTFPASVVDKTNKNLNLKLVVNYPGGSETFYYTINYAYTEKGLLYYAPLVVQDLGQPWGIILSIILTAIILAILTFSGLDINKTAILIIGIAVLGVFMFLGWLDVGISVFGVDIARFFYALMCCAVVYLIMRGEQYA